MKIFLTFFALVCMMGVKAQGYDPRSVAIYVYDSTKLSAGEKTRLADFYRFTDSMRLDRGVADPDSLVRYRLRYKNECTAIEWYNYMSNMPPPTEHYCTLLVFEPVAWSMRELRQLGTVITNGSHYVRIIARPEVLSAGEFVSHIRYNEYYLQRIE